jgi:hypothetical protein
MVVYQRDLNRRFVHLKKVIQALKATHKPSAEGIVWDVEVIRHRENAEPCGLYKTLHSADILLTAHGFQSTGNRYQLVVHFCKWTLIIIIQLNSTNVYEERLRAY